MGSIFLCQNIFLTSPLELFPKLSTTWQLGLEIVALPTSAQWQDMELICGGLFTRQRERRERDAYVCLRPVEMFMQKFRATFPNPLVPGDFFLSLLMKVHTEVHYGNRLGNPKYQVSAFIHYQDMEIFIFRFF